MRVVLLRVLCCCCCVCCAAHAPAPGWPRQIKKKSAEVERGEKRLKSLQTVRPAFMDEYEKLEVELQRQYELYLERFRNLDYLEHELGKYDQEEREKAEEAERALRRMQDRWRKQEEALNRGVQDLEGADPLAVPRRQERAAARPAAAYARCGAPVAFAARGCRCHGNSCCRWLFSQLPCRRLVRR